MSIKSDNWIRRMAQQQRLIEPFELRTAFSRQRFSQLLMIEGEPPAAAIRLEHDDVAAIRAQFAQRAGTKLQQYACW